MSSAAQQIVFVQRAPASRQPVMCIAIAHGSLPVIFTPWTARSVILYITHQTLNLQKQRGTDIPARRVRRAKTSARPALVASLSEHLE
jgi:hypothetical protein